MDHSTMFMAVANKIKAATTTTTAAEKTAFIRIQFRNVMLNIAIDLFIFFSFRIYVFSFLFILKFHPKLWKSYRAPKSKYTHVAWLIPFNLWHKKNFKTFVDSKYCCI